MLDCGLIMVQIKAAALAGLPGNANFLIFSTEVGKKETLSKSDGAQTEALSMYFNASLRSTVIHGQ